MNAKEILDYTFKFWENRKTLDKKGVYKAICKDNNRIVVYTPWGTIHHSITFCKNTFVYFYWIDQQHYKGLELQENIFKLTKREFYNKFKQQQIVLEHSPII